MPADVVPRLEIAALARLLEAADAATLLISPRLMRRIIRRDRGLTGVGLHVPHRKSYIIGRDSLLALVAREELGLARGRELPPKVLLLAAPDPVRLASRPNEITLLKYWRLLFHLHVHKAIAVAHLDATAVRDRIRRIGQAEFDEARSVMVEERLLLPPRDDSTAYEEFAALYLELRFFVPTLLPYYFPAVESFERIDRILAEDVDAAALFAASRLAGAPEPADVVEVPDELVASAYERIVAQPERLAYADRASAVGNNVRAAIEAYRGGDDGRVGQELQRLVNRLQSALELSDADVVALPTSLAALVAPPNTNWNVWTAEARLLFDLQNVCIDSERPVYAPDIVEWAYSLFRRPLVRPLPDQPLVLVVKHLRRAAERLPTVRIDSEQRHALAGFLNDALHRTEAQLRNRFRPILTNTCNAVGLRASNYPERVARDKLVDELLDVLADRGFLKLGDLRDALSRNGLKLPDLTGPAEFIGGDPLLRANRELAVRAPGLYRRGEIYLRWLQRGSSVAFGTHPGRLFVRHVAIPFGGAYATVVFAQEMLHLVRLPHHLESGGLAGVVGALGVFYLLLMNWPVFRHRVSQCARVVGRLARVALFEVPAAALRLAPVRWVFESRWVRAVRDTAADWLARPWDYVRGFVPGLVRLFVDAFKTGLEWLDRGLYAVDEWLRFRGGEGRGSLAAKTVLGFAWFLVAYVVRLTVNVFVEPTVNPVKHFPAVTVAAKMLVPFWIPLTELFATPLMFLGKPLAISLAFFVIHLLPGAAGFLVWELKENWRLYGANRAANLSPVVVGHHGETLPRLLRPGFHSGTLPKLYAKLRRTGRRAIRTGDWRPVRKLRAALLHTEEAIRHFAERDLVAFVEGSRNWASGPLHLTAIDAGSVRIRLSLSCPAHGDEPLDLTFEEQSGCLLADVARPGWLPRLSVPETEVLALALSGLYKAAGVDLVREQIEASFPPPAPAYDISGGRLFVWTGDTEAVYDLEEGPILHPRIFGVAPAVPLPPLEARRLLFGRRTVPWRDWVEAWARDQAGKGQPGPLVPGVRVLPPVRARDRETVNAARPR